LAGFNTIYYDLTIWPWLTFWATLAVNLSVPAALTCSRNKQHYSNHGVSGAHHIPFIFAFFAISTWLK